MPDAEVFTRPTVKQVIFAINFPNLFFIESKIGEFQLLIMSKFPLSSELTKRKMLFVNALSNVNIDGLKNTLADPISKVWSFKSTDGVEVNVESNSLSIVSNSHKSYKSDPSSRNFKDIIEFIVSNFIKIAPIPIFNRIGLRYIDHAPIKNKSNSSLTKLYNTGFPVDKFDFGKSNEMTIRAVINKDDHIFIYTESLPLGEDPAAEKYLILDFDAFKVDIEVKDYIACVDRLHQSISGEFLRTVKEPVKVFMRGGELKDE